MKYTFESRIRFSEIGEDRKLTLNSIINYFQDCSNFQSEELNLGLETLEKQKRAWILSSWQICVRRRPAMGEAVAVGTWAYDFKGFYGYRNFELKSGIGEVLAYANSIWVFLDTESGKPTRIVPEEVAAYGHNDKLEMEYAPRKINIPKNGVLMEAFRIKRHHLDVYHHVNNGQYIQMAKEYLPEDFTIRQMRAEYKKQAVLDDVIVPQVHVENEVYTIILCDEEMEPYTVVEFR